MKKDTQLLIRLTQEQKEAIKIYCIRKGLTVSELFRISVMKMISEEEHQKMKEDLCNLNDVVSGE